MARNLEDNRQTVSRDVLLDVAAKIGREWEDVGRRIGLEEADLESIREENHGKQKEIKYQMLLTWKQRNGACATYSVLADALEKAGRRDIVHEVLRQGAEVHSIPVKRRRITEIPALLRDKQLLFISELKRVYKRKFFNVRPVPNDGSVQYCVNDIYTESGMRVKSNKKSTSDPTCWTEIKSRHTLLQRITEGTIVIEGEPGFGKSILLTQYAYDWYSSTAESPLTKDTIFILIRLREVKVASSIYEIIKLLLLNDLSLSCNEIEDIITSHNWKIVLAFDGFDEFEGKDSTHVNILKIIQGRMLTPCLVIVSTRPKCWTKLQNSTEVRCQLTGFDKCTQNMYIEKVIIPYTEQRDIKTLIFQKLQENGVLSDICQVPLFFVIVAHRKYENHDELNITTVTGYFKYMLMCFLIHSKSKETDKTKSQYTRQEEPHRHRAWLAKFAFDGLSQQKSVWEKNEMMKLVDLSCYNYYIQAGIILEEHNSWYKVHPGSHMDDEMLDEIKVRFFHKTFQEYYAAIHFVHLVSKEPSMDVSSMLSTLYGNGLQYFFRFACGLKPTAAKVVQDYLRGLSGGEIFSILCIVEQETQDIGEIVKKLCNRTMTIDWSDSRILVSAKIQVLQIASHQKSPIKDVTLCNCFSSVDLMNESLCIFGDVQLPRFDTLRELEIFHEFFTDLRDVANAILDFSSRCKALKTLKFSTFDFVFLPQSFDEDHVLAELRRRKVKVKWFNFCWFHCRLNLQTGKWKTINEKEMTDREYSELLKEYFGPPKAVDREKGNEDDDSDKSSYNEEDSSDDEQWHESEYDEDEI